MMILVNMPNIQTTLGDMWKAMDNPVVKSTIETLISMHDE
jgi:hypothetical protein